MKGETVKPHFDTSEWVCVSCSTIQFTGSQLLNELILSYDILHTVLKGAIHWTGTRLASRKGHLGSFIVYKSRPCSKACFRTRTSKRRAVVLEGDQGLFEANLKRNMSGGHESIHLVKRCGKHHFMKYCLLGCVLPSGWFLPPSQTISFAHQTSVRQWWDSSLTSGRLLLRRGEGSWLWPLDMRKGDERAMISYRGFTKNFRYLK